MPARRRTVCLLLLTPSPRRWLCCTHTCARVPQGAAVGPGPSLTVFHGLRAPPISIEGYLVRIAKYAKCSPACFVTSLVHMLRLAGRDASYAPTRLNVHRLLLTGVLVSAKFLDDRYFNNAYYAKVRARRRPAAQQQE